VPGSGAAVPPPRADWRSSPSAGGRGLFDLALARKIDTGTEEIQILDTSPTGNRTMDRIQAGMAGQPDLKTVRSWIERIFLSCHDLEGEALRPLIARGILRLENSRKLWIIDVERFPLVHDRHQRLIKLRRAGSASGCCRTWRRSAARSPTPF